MLVLLKGLGHRASTVKPHPSTISTNSSTLFLFLYHPQSILFSSSSRMSTIPLMAFHRAQNAARLISSSHLASSSSQLIHLPSHRHAMMSALSRPSTSRPPLPHTPAPTLGETPPVVATPSTGKTPSPKDFSADASSPQIAARPPPLPKVERPRPQIRATKAAISMVRHFWNLFFSEFELILL